MISRGMRMVVIAGLLLLGVTASSAAQLRPLPPLDWQVFDDSTLVTAQFGGGILHDQRASLAGTEGRLVEIGNFAIAARSGRIAVEAAGTMVRLFDDRSTFAEPWGGPLPSNGEQRRDAGDFRLSTLVLLTRPDRPSGLVLRFGTRLPTTDNDVGLDRDRTDFFALLAGRLRLDDLELAGEAGVGINGTHDARMEQSDVLMYSATAAYRVGAITPRISLVGHLDGMSGLAIRGNEELAEVRVGARFGRRIWGEAQVVQGFQPFSPSRGVVVSAGISR